MKDTKSILHALNIAHVLQWILNIGLIILAAVLVFFLAKETFTMASLMFVNEEGATAYELLEGIIIYFLYFEFIALIIKYFTSSYHFPLRYFIYIGITAIVRLIIVDHNDAMHTILNAGAILLLVCALFLASTETLKRE